MATSNEKTSAFTSGMERKVIPTRIFDAPGELVFKAWTDSKHMAQWWGPHGRPNGLVYPTKGVYREVEPERLVFTAVAEDEEGNPLLEGLTTVTFTEHDGKTTLTLQTRAVGFVPGAAGMFKGMEPGWTQILERLTAHVSAESKEQSL